jgi:hypothetical protein
MQRLASEVGWRLFVVGNTVYYMSEQQLYQRRARYEVDPDDAAVLDVSYDVDWGKPVSELALTVSLERWGAPPGSVVLVDGFGPADGRWLVTSVSASASATRAGRTTGAAGTASPSGRSKTETGSTARGRCVSRSSVRACSPSSTRW